MEAKRPALALGVGMSAARWHSQPPATVRRHVSVLSAAVGLVAMLAGVVVGASKTLDIYFIDTEGGQSTLLVSPSGETFLIDTGFAGLDTPNPDKDVGRDAARIADVARIAKVKRIDALLATHFHGDHASGVTHLTKVLEDIRKGRRVVHDDQLAYRRHKGVPGTQGLESDTVR
jgi:glyoxylase-like metal-dependent hydrolase (beta-lactamase superfamily II)